MTRRISIFVWLFASVLLAVAHQGVRAQRAPLPLAQMQHRVWTEHDGLPVDRIYTPQRTPDGYLWIGTNDAVLRFDGVRFVRMDSTNTPALRSRVRGSVLLLWLDRSGWLWLSRPDGMLVRYRDGAFHEFAVADGDAGPSILVEDRTGLLWGIARGLFVVRGKRVETPALPPGVRPSDVSAVIPDNGNGVWIGTFKGALWNLTPSGAHSLDVSKLDVDPTGRATAVRPLLQQSDGRLWILKDAVHSYANGEWSTPLVGAPAHGFAGLRATALRDGSVIFATRGDGLIRWNAGAVEQYGVTDGLSAAGVESAIEDDDESLWITTDAGLDRLRQAPFAVLGRHDGSPFESPRTLFIDDDGSLWVLRGGSLQLFHVTGGIVSRVPRPLDVREVKLPDGSFETLGPARGGGIWYYGRDGHVARYRNGVATPLRASGMPMTRPVTAYEDSSGGLWLTYTTHDFGVVRQGRYIPIPVPGGKGHVGLMAPAGRESIWATVEDPDVDMLVKFSGDSVAMRLDTPGRKDTFFGTLLVEGADTVWATAGGELIRVANGRASAVRVPDVARVVVGYSNALQLSGGYLWFAGEAGMGRISVNALHRAADGVGPSPHAEIFTALDGIPVPKLGAMNVRASFRGNDGRIWFSTPAGVAVVDPSQFHSDTTPPVSHIEEIVAVGRAVAPASTTELAPNPEQVEIHFTATDLRVPERAHIEYRLDGVNASWIEATPARVATYTQLRPGSYRFHVRARAGSGAFGPEVSTVLRVRPAWYQTWWFRSLVAIALVALLSLLVYAIVRARARAHAARMRERFEAEINERTRMARELHDTLLQGFQGITLQLHAVRRTVLGSPRDAESTLSRVLELADLSLRDARAMVWDMRAPELDALDLHAALETAARTAATAMASSGVTVDCRIEGKPRRLSPAAEMAILRIGKEAIANAVAHSAASAIHVVLSYEPVGVRLTIRDDGRGLDPETVTRANALGHWGLRGMHERAAQIGATLEITSVNGRGTSIALIVPVGHQALPPSQRARPSLRS